MPHYKTYSNAAKKVLWYGSKEVEKEADEKEKEAEVVEEKKEDEEAAKEEKKEEGEVGKEKEKEIDATSANKNINPSCLRAR